MKVALSEVFTRGGAGGEDLARARPRGDRAAARRATARSIPGTGRSPRRSRSSPAGSTAPGASPSRRRPRIAWPALREAGLRQSADQHRQDTVLFLGRSQEGRPSRRGSRSTSTRRASSPGAGFVVAICGDIMTMPGLPKQPAAETIDVDDGRAGLRPVLRQVFARSTFVSTAESVFARSRVDSLLHAPDQKVCTVGWSLTGDLQSC